jgi:outer membrane protein TolC
MFRVYILLVFLLFAGELASAQNTRSLDYYLQAAGSYSPELKENLNLQKTNLLQADLNKSQLRKPQVFVSADYLFAPFFFNNGQFISITPNPTSEAIGYDPGLSNGGLYSGLLNISYPIFNGSIYKATTLQIENQNKILKNTNSRALHDLENNVKTQYVIIYQLQQQILYSKKIIDLVTDRKKIVHLLVEQGIMQQSDYLLLDIEISSRQFDIVQLKTTLSDAFTTLNNLCGISDTTLFELGQPELKLTGLLPRFNYEQKYALDSLDIALQQLVANTKYKPQVMVFGNTGLNAIDAENIPHNLGLSAGIHLSIPIYDGHQKKINNEQFKLTQLSLGNYKSDQIIQQKNKLNALLQQIQNVTLSISFIDKQLEQQNELLLLIKDKVASGQVSVTDYLDAIKDFALANQNKIQSQTQLWQLINQYNYINW